MKRISIMIFSLLFTVICFAQKARTKSKSKPKSDYAIGISGGYFLDGKMSDFSNEGYSGFNLFQADFQIIEPEKKKGFNFIYTTKSTETKGVSLNQLESRYTMWINYYVMSSYFKTEKGTGLYFGVFGGALYDFADQKPLIAQPFDSYVRNIALATGPKIEYNHYISGKVSILSGCQITLVEIGFQKTVREDPLIPIRAQYTNVPYFALATRLNLNLGVSFVL